MCEEGELFEGIKRAGEEGLDLRNMPGFDDRDPRFTTKELRESRFHPLLAGTGFSVLCLTAIAAYLSTQVSCDTRRASNQVLAHSTLTQ